MSIYQRYLANQTPTPLVLTAPEDVVDMGVDSNGNFVCSGDAFASGLDNHARCAVSPGEQMQQQQLEQQQQNNPFNQSGQQQPAQQQQQQQQPAKQEKSDGVAGWIKDMFGGN